MIGDGVLTVILQQGHVFAQLVQIPHPQHQAHIRLRNRPCCRIHLKPYRMERAEVKGVFLHRCGDACAGNHGFLPDKHTAVGTDGDRIEAVAAAVPAQRTKPQNQQRHQQVKPCAGTPLHKVLQGERVEPQTAQQRKDQKPEVLGTVPQNLDRVFVISRFFRRVVYEHASLLIPMPAQTAGGCTPYFAGTPESPPHPPAAKTTAGSFRHRRGAE